MFHHGQPDGPIHRELPNRNNWNNIPVVYSFPIAKDTIILPISMCSVKVYGDSLITLRIIDKNKHNCLIMRIVDRIKNKLFIELNPWMRKNVVNRINKWRLKNKQITLLANNCNGACMLHDLGLPFNSPFVNLWLYPEDFIKYVENIEHYMKCSLAFEERDDYPYPVGVLDDIHIYFQHYKSQHEAKEKWETRTRRMDLNHIYVLMTERDGCTHGIMERFDRLPVKHKVILTHLSYADISSSFYIKGFENENQCGILSEFVKSHYFGKYYYDQFDYTGWFNNLNKHK